MVSLDVSTVLDFVAIAEMKIVDHREHDRVIVGQQTADNRPTVCRHGCRGALLHNYQVISLTLLQRHLAAVWLTAAVISLGSCFRMKEPVANFFTYVQKCRLMRFNALYE